MSRGAERRESPPAEATVRDALRATASAPADRKPSRLVPGDIVAGKYIVDRTLGMGGMGQVVAARHATLGTKVVHPELARDADTVARLLREAHAMARLQSEHTVRVLDIGETADGLPSSSNRGAVYESL